MDALSCFFHILNAEEDRDDCPFERGKSRELMDQYCKKYLTRERDPKDDQWSDLMSLITAERERSFKVGFKIALSVLGELNNTEIPRLDKTDIPYLS